MVFPFAVPLSQRAWQGGGMMAPRVSVREMVYENPYQQVFRIRVDFEEYSKEYFVNEHGCRCGVVVADGDRVLLVRQYRFLVNGPAWEIPGGKRDSQESPEVAAAREVCEETGLRCHDLAPLLAIHPCGLDTVHNPSHAFYTRRFERVPGIVADRREISEQAWLPLEECVRMIFRGEILDGFTISALLMFRMVCQQPELAPAGVSALTGWAPEGVGIER